MVHAADPSSVLHISNDPFKTWVGTPVPLVGELHLMIFPPDPGRNSTQFLILTLGNPEDGFQK